MATSTAFNTRELIDLETRYWEAVQRHDGRAAASLTAPDCLYVGEGGVNMFDPEAIRSMTDAAGNDFEFEIDQKSLKVLPLSDDVAVVAYRVTQTMKDAKGERKSAEAISSTTWVRKENAWQAAMHSHATAG